MKSLFIRVFSGIFLRKDDVGNDNDNRDAIDYANDEKNSPRSLFNTQYPPLLYSYSRLSLLSML